MKTRSEAAFTRLEVRGRPKGPRRTGTPARRSRGWGEKENDRGSGHLGRSSGAASKSPILPSRSAKPTWKPFGLPTLNRKAGSAD